jgi:hypothetical protein
MIDAFASFGIVTLAAALSGLLIRAAIIHAEGTNPRRQRRK